MFSSVVGAPPELHAPNVFTLQLLILLSSGFRCRYNLRRHVNIVLYTTSRVSSLLYICSAHLKYCAMPMNQLIVIVGMTLKYSKTELCNTRTPKILKYESFHTA